MEIEQIFDSEYNSLHARISEVDSAFSEFAELIERLPLIKAYLQIAGDRAKDNQYSLAYKMLLEAMNALISLNMSIVEKLPTVMSAIHLNLDSLQDAKNS